MRGFPKSRRCEQRHYWRFWYCELWHAEFPWTQKISSYVLIFIITFSQKLKTFKIIPQDGMPSVTQNKRVSEKQTQANASSCTASSPPSGQRIRARYQRRGSVTRYNIENSQSMQITMQPASSQKKKSPSRWCPKSGVSSRKRLNIDFHLKQMYPRYPSNDTSMTHTRQAAMTIAYFER